MAGDLHDPELNSYVRYGGDAPFTGDAVTTNVPGFPNQTHAHTEGWGSHVDSSGRGLGWFVPNVYTSTNYNYVGTGGTGDLADSTSYSAPIPSLAISPHSVYEYDYWLVVGTPDDARELAARKWASSQSTWDFDRTRDRQMWSASAPVDGDGPTASGWTLQQKAAQTVSLTSPPSTIPADERSVVELDLEHSTGASRVDVSWTTNDGNRTGHATVPIQADGARQSYRLDLSGVSQWTGDIENLTLSFPASVAGEVTVHRVAVLPAATTRGPAPLIRSTRTRALGQGAVDVAVTTPAAATASIDYGQTRSLTEHTEETRQLATSQTLHLSNLQPGSRYYYRIVVRDDQGRETTGPLRTLVVPRDRKPTAGLVVSLDPVDQAVSTSGGSTTFTADLDAIADTSLSGSLTATGPDGWTITPESTRFRLVSNGRQVQRTVSLAVESPTGLEPGVAYPITVTATADNGLTSTASGSVRFTATEADWEFDTGGDAEGWSATNSLSSFDVSDGLLHTTTTGTDPYLVQSRPLAVTSTNGVVVEIALQTSKPGTAQFFYSTPSGSFSAANSVTFATSGTGMKTYQVTIPAQDGPITGLRFDPTDGAGATLSIDYIRLTSK